MHRRWSLAAMLALLLAGPSAPVVAQESGFPLPALEVITPENAGRVAELAAVEFDGEVFDAVWSADGTVIGVFGSLGVWLLELDNHEVGTRMLESDDDDDTWTTRFC